MNVKEVCSFTADGFVFLVVFFRDFVVLRALLSHSDIAEVIYGIGRRQKKRGREGGGEERGRKKGGMEGKKGREDEIGVREREEGGRTRGEKGREKRRKKIRGGVGV